MSSQTLTKEEKVEMKRERVPVHEARDKLSTRGLDHDNFHYRFTNLSNTDRVDRNLRAGYEFVTKGGGMVGDQTVASSDGLDSIVTISAGGGDTLALMALPMEFYLQDLAAKEAKIRDKESDMKRDLQAKTDSRLGIGQGVQEFGTGLKPPTSIA